MFKTVYRTDKGVYSLNRDNTFKHPLLINTERVIRVEEEYDETCVFFFPVMFYDEGSRAGKYPFRYESFIFLKKFLNER